MRLGSGRDISPGPGRRHDALARRPRAGEGTYSPEDPRATAEVIAAFARSPSGGPTWRK